MPSRCRRIILTLVLGLTGCLSVSCQKSKADVSPTIEFSHVPPLGDGSSQRLEPIEGRVRGARPGQRIVLFALSGVWWVQPLAEEPYTAIQKDSTFKSSTHPGAAYAALLVDAHYRPPLTAETLPAKGGSVLAVSTVTGAPPSSSAKAIQFSGYQWEIVQNAAEDRGANFHDRQNVWTDNRGFLHLRVTKRGDQWASAEVKLSRSLGYGSYRFVVHDVSHLEPAAVFALFTFDYQGPSREMDIEISRWGEPEDKNAQYVVQPYIFPANTVRFAAPAGPLTYWIDWEPGRVLFQTMRGAAAKRSEILAEHAFTSGVPSAGNERIHMNLWEYRNQHHPLQQDFEVVIEKFEFLP